MTRRNCSPGLILLCLCCLAATRSGPLTTRPVADIPVKNISIDAASNQGPLELWRHALGHGGINSLPLPDRVVNGVKQLRPRLIRIFIQEFFFIYPEHGRFDWTRLDPYMDALARTDAKIVAAITIKPRPLYPKIDQRIWRPNDVAEWQKVIRELVKRYSVDKPIVTHWEIGNETDIGENGGCPHLIQDPADYAEYYRMTIDPILDVFPQAKVGGPAVANAGSDFIARFIQQCRDRKLRLDFISWHLYSDDPAGHAGLIRRYRDLLKDFPGNRPEMLVTEWSKSFDRVSLEDIAFEPRRAATIAASIIAMTDAQPDWTFYYHIWDQVACTNDFKQFFQNPRIMYTHWNEIPHRFALFGVNGEARPQYFVYQMISRMAGQRLVARSDDPDLRILASRDAGRISVLISNFNLRASQDRIASIRLRGLAPGRKKLRTWRIDRTCAWSDQDLKLPPLEQREIDSLEDFHFQVLCPADSVLLVTLEDRP